MFVPEYTITPLTLKNIAAIEYNRALAENTTILESFEFRLEKESLVGFIISSINTIGEHANEDVIKRYVDGMVKVFTPQIANLKSSIGYVPTLAAHTNIEEKDIKFLHALVSKNIIAVTHQGTYRRTKIENKVEPETILAEINDLIDWVNGIDAIDTNPVIVAGIVKAQLETIYPFDKFNEVIADLCVKVILENKGYKFHKYTTVEKYYMTSRKAYEEHLLSVIGEDSDFTAWLEYFTEGIAAQCATLGEKVKLYSRDTKLAKVSGRIRLTQRQEKIIEYLQDYGMLQNSNFPQLFPDISEDSVLRDLSKLVDEGIVVKLGKTKSSRYELK